jgi:hypothetical protein
LDQVKVRKGASKGARPRTWIRKGASRDGKGASLYLQAGVLQNSRRKVIPATFQGLMRPATQSGIQGSNPPINPPVCRFWKILAQKMGTSIGTGRPRSEIWPSEVRSGMWLAGGVRAAPPVTSPRSSCSVLRRVSLVTSAVISRQTDPLASPTTRLASHPQIWVLAPSPAWGGGGGRQVG